MTSSVFLMLPLLLVSWSGAQPVGWPLSEALKSQETHEAVQQVSHHYQRAQSEEDASFRLLPRTNDLESWKACCLFVNILDYYVRNILPLRHHEHPMIVPLHIDLTRISDDLHSKGCVSIHYRDHEHTVTFREKLRKMELDRQGVKALSEVDILFSNLHDKCVRE